jgi:deoxyribodipyrimidine photolyase-related protein
MIGIVFPHQLFETSLIIDTCSKIYIIEEYLFFKQFAFHKQKLAFHRASMQFYASYLLAQNKAVIYVDAQHDESDIRHFVAARAQEHCGELCFIDPSDNYLTRRLNSAAQKHQLALVQHATPLFMNTQEENRSFFAGKKRMFQADFYMHQRKKSKILLDGLGKPLGGKWSFDEENRLKYPKDKRPPITHFLAPNAFYQ